MKLPGWTWLHELSIPYFSSWDHPEATKTMENINKSVIFSRTGRHTQKYLQDLQFTQEPRRRKQRKTKGRDASSSKFQRAAREEWSVYVQTDFLKTQDPWCRTSYPKRGFRKRWGGSERSPYPQWAWLVAGEKKGQLRCASHNLNFWTFSFFSVAGRKLPSFSFNCHSSYDWGWWSLSTLFPNQFWLNL